MTNTMKNPSRTLCRKILSLADDFGLVKMLEFTGNLSDFPEDEIRAAITGFVDGDVLATDGKHYWRP